ncbi:MAG: DUF2520 domain-containing protein [Calditrichaeota bacterium]|nr:DUF2520 domain-containing protein [Calditrichota bacterium]
MKEINRISIVGSGRVGFALAKALAEGGFSILGLFDRDPERLEWAKRQDIAEKYSVKLDDLTSGDAIFICVSDDRIRVVARQLAQMFAEKKLVQFAFHCSGSLSADVLQPLSKYGVKIGSMHPVGTFSGAEDDNKKLRGIFWAVEGDELALSAAKSLIRRLQGEFIVLPKSAKPLHHLACTFASNYVNFLLSIVVELYRELGVDEESAQKLIMPLVKTTIENIGKRGLQESLTGPAARGDLGTIEKHLKILSEQFPEFEIIYKKLGGRIFEYPSVMNRLEKNVIQRMKELFNQ